MLNGTIIQVEILRKTFARKCQKTTTTTKTSREWGTYKQKNHHCYLLK